MTNRVIAVLCVVAMCVAMVAQDEPTLVTINMPNYPPLARQARIEGVVKLTFILPANAEGPTKVEVVSGHQMLKDAALDNVKTWKFENPYAVERKTTFSLTIPILWKCDPKGGNKSICAVRNTKSATRLRALIWHGGAGMPSAVGWQRICIGVECVRNRGLPDSSQFRRSCASALHPLGTRGHQG